MSGEVCLVRLFAGKSVTGARISKQRRIEEGKIHTIEALRTHQEKLTDLDQLVPDRKSLELDTGELSPKEAAEAIISHYHLGIDRRLG